MTPDEVDWAIREAALGRLILIEATLRSVLAHVAAAGFDPMARERARGDLAGVRWRGRVLSGGDRLPSSVRHYLKHVVKLREWPDGTTHAIYLRSLREVAEHPHSGVFTSWYQGEPQLGVIRES